MENNVVGEHEHSRWSWQAKLGIFVVLVYSAILFSLYLKLKHLPGPYYGGDLYAHHGFALNYIMNGFWADPYFINNYSFYPWLGNYTFILLSLLPGISLMQAQNFIPIIWIMISAVAYYFLGLQLFKNRNWALVMMLFSLFMRGIPGGAPINLPWMITIPFWFAFWLRAEDTGRLRDKVYAGIFMGLTSLAHVAFFIASIGVFAFTIIIETFLKDNRKQALVNSFKMYWPMLLVGFIVSLPFYGPIIVNYHAETLNPLFQYNGPNVETLGISWALGTVWRSMINFSTVSQSILTVLKVLGLFVCITHFRKKSARYALWWLIAGSLIPLHHLVTRPLLDRWVLPGHVWGSAIAFIIFAVYGAQLAQVVLEKYFSSKKIVLIGVFVVCLLLFWNSYDYYKNDRWVNFGEQLDSSTQAWSALGDWVTRNTDENAVFLTHEESCFAVNGFSGRKCVFVRRTHANYFVDIEQRFADGIVMMYGNNIEVTNKLIEEYEIDYLLLDAIMMQNPILIDAKFESYLTENNVSFEKVRARKDPAEPAALVFDLLAVPIQPLNVHLESRLSEVAQFNIQNQPALRILKVSP